MGASHACCVGKVLLRETTPALGEACRFRIPEVKGVLSSLPFVVYDASAQAKTAWLSLVPSSTDLAKRPGTLQLHRAFPDDSDKPLATVEARAWEMKRLEGHTASERSRAWRSGETFANQYVWEATRFLEAFGPDSQQSSGSSQGAPSAWIRVSHQGFAGSTNLADSLPEIYSGDADLETDACVKECLFTSEFKGAPVALEWEIEMESGMLKIQAARPEFGIWYERGDVRIRSGDTVEPLLACALGFAAARFGNPWTAEELAAEAAEEEVRGELQQSIAASLVAAS